MGGATRVAPPHRPDCSLEYLAGSGNKTRDLHTSRLPCVFERRGRVNAVDFTLNLSAKPHIPVDKQQRNHHGCNRGAMDHTGD